MNLPQNYTIEHMGESIEISYSVSCPSRIRLPWSGYQILASIGGEPAAYLKNVVVEEEHYNQLLNQPIWFSRFDGQYPSIYKYFEPEYQENKKSQIIIEEGRNAINDLLSWNQKKTETVQSFHQNLEFFENFRKNMEFLNDFARDKKGLQQLEFYLYHVNCVIADFCESYKRKDNQYLHYQAQNRDRVNRLDFSEYGLEKLLLIEAAKFENSRGRPLYKCMSISKEAEIAFDELIAEGHAFETQEITSYAKTHKILKSRKLIDFRDNAQELLDKNFKNQKKLFNNLKKQLNRKNKIYQDEFYENLVQMRLIYR